MGGMLGNFHAFTCLSRGSHWRGNPEPSFRNEEGVETG
jgi:hypothetical protein